MNISYIVAGLSFFFLPNLSIIDIMPDFIGALLIIKGLNKLADLTPGLMDAKNAFVKVFYFSIVKFLLMFTVPYFSNNDGGYVLIFTFTFVVLDLIYALPAFRSLLNGFLYLGDRTNSSSIFNNQSEFSTLTTIFIFVRAGLPLLTDLSYISAPEYSNVVTSENVFYLANFKTLLVALNFLITGIVGVVWFNYAQKYFKGIQNDKQLMDYLEKQYDTNILPNKGLFTRRAFSGAKSCFLVAGLFMFDFYLDYVNILPDFVGGLFFVFGIWLILKRCECKTTIKAAVAYSVLALISWIVLCAYAVKYPVVNIFRNEKAAAFFSIVNVFSVLKYIALAVLFYFLYKTLNDVIKKHTGSAVEELQSISNRNAELQKEMYKANRKCFWLGIISCVTSVVRLILIYDVGWFQLIDYAFVTAWFISFTKLFGAIYSSVEYKYL